MVTVKKTGFSRRIAARDVELMERRSRRVCFEKLVKPKPKPPDLKNIRNQEVEESLEESSFEYIIHTGSQQQEL